MANVLSGITLDVSNWDDPTFDAPCFKAAGVERIVVGCQYRDIARRQVRASQAAGIHVMGVYAFLYFGSNVQATTQVAIDVAREFGVPVVWLDAEADASGVALTPARRNAELRACVAQVRAAGLQVGIYTAGWWWTPKHATREFGDIPLWHAEYGANDGQLPPKRTVSYGGWSHCVLHQYTSTGGLCGRAERDRNHVWDDAPGLEDGMSSAEYNELKAENAALRTQLNDLMVACLAGGEERDANGATLPVPVRLVTAAHRVNVRVKGEGGTVARSVADIGASAEANVRALSERLDDLLEGEPGEVPIGQVPDHVHTLPQLGQTGGVAGIGGGT